MTQRKKKKGYSANPLSAHEAGKTAPHTSRKASRPTGSVQYDPEEDALIADPPLSVRENEMLFDVAHGQSNKQISSGRKVSLATVQKHVENIFPKIKAHSRTDAAIWFLKRELVKRDRRIEQQARRITELERRLAALGS